VATALLFFVIPSKSRLFITHLYLPNFLLHLCTFQGGEQIGW